MPAGIAPVFVMLALLTVPTVATGQGKSSAQTAATRAASVDQTREVLEGYWKNHDPKYVAEDAVFTMMPSGEVISGRAAIARHLEGFYHGALDARAEVVNAVFGEGEGVLEALVVGRHSGIFSGIAATGREVRVPLSVAYELENGLIQKARIYLMVNVLVAQISDGIVPSR